MSLNTLKIHNDFMKNDIQFWLLVRNYRQQQANIYK